MAELELGLAARREGSVSRRMAVDVGGTFIDVVAIEPETGAVTMEKQRATPDRLAEEVLRGARRLPGANGRVSRLSHGTTVAINTLVQQRGASVGLLTTAGFRDVLEIGRGARPQVYDFLYSPAAPLVPRRLRREVPERVSASGEVVVGLDLDALSRELEFLVDEGVQGIAICFLHSYANPVHERLAAERIRLEHPGIHVTVSSEVTAEWREFERASTAVSNAYVAPFFQGYIEDLEEGVASSSIADRLVLMQSSGGVIASERAKQLPVRTLESGPAGGVVGAWHLAGRLGDANVICADVGGTTYDIAIIEGGSFLERTETRVGGRPILGPAIEIASIGAGGGSVAWLDEDGGLQVGPRSAGAAPGPACFALGGTEPTVTDCQLLLGMINPSNFLGARLSLDQKAAEEAITAGIALPLGLDVVEAATGVVAIAETNMTLAMRAMTIERGLDPRDFALYSYGGGGGLFAAATAAELGIARVVIPRLPSSFSAWGILMADFREDAALTRVRSLGDDTWPEITRDLAGLAEEVNSRFRAHGVDPADVRFQYRVDARFAGQEHAITVDVEPEVMNADALRAGFVAGHRQLYGHGSPDADIEVATARCRGTVPTEPPVWDEWRVGADAAPKEDRAVYHKGSAEWVLTPVYDRETLARGQLISGPAIVEEWSTTVMVPPSWSVTIEALGMLVLTPTVDAT